MHVPTGRYEKRTAMAVTVATGAVIPRQFARGRVLCESDVFLHPPSGEFPHLLSRRMILLRAGIGRVPT